MANQGKTYIAPFWKENQLVQINLKILKIYIEFFLKTQPRAHNLENQDASLDPRQGPTQG
jgi:hypothetical protein